MDSPISRETVANLAYEMIMAGRSAKEVSQAIRALPSLPTPAQPTPHHEPNWLWCERCQAWIETWHFCGAQYVDKGDHIELVCPAVTPAQPTDSNSTKADNPLTPKQDNSAFDSMPRKQMPWTTTFPDSASVPDAQAEARQIGLFLVVDVSKAWGSDQFDECVIATTIDRKMAFENILLENPNHRVFVDAAALQASRDETHVFDEALAESEKKIISLAAQLTERDAENARLEKDCDYFENEVSRLRAQLSTHYNEGLERAAEIADGVKDEYGNPDRIAELGPLEYDRGKTFAARDIAAAIRAAKEKR